MIPTYLAELSIPIQSGAVNKRVSRIEKRMSLWNKPRLISAGGVGTRGKKEGRSDSSRTVSTCAVRFARGLRCFLQCL